MKWEEARKHYEHQWLLIEATEAHTESGERILDQVSVVGVFDDSLAALKEYARLHEQWPQREFYVFNSDRQQTKIRARQLIGVRGRR